MAFVPISSFLPGRPLRPSASFRRAFRRAPVSNGGVSTVVAKQGKDAPKFEPFDGSKPLLPPWRPQSLEQDFSHVASRISIRQRAQPPPRLVQLHAPGYATLFASVVQTVKTDGKRDDGERLWLRPLLLDGVHGFVDMRGVSDLVWDAAVVQEVDQQTCTRVRVNLAATDAELSSRAAFDEDFSDVASGALLDFVERLTGSKE